MFYGSLNKLKLDYICAYQSEHVINNICIVKAGIKDKGQDTTPLTHIN